MSKAPVPVGLRPYSPETTARRFHASTAFVRGMRGPVGSGKSVACCMEAFSRALEQQPHTDKIRRSRWCFIRGTYGELISTTMQTWKDWVPTSICPISLSAPICASLDAPCADGTRVQAEFFFLAIDREEDVDKLKSLELTGVWINEASDIKKGVLDMATSRVGRYPPLDMGGPSWTGVILDTNPPDTDHWWYKLAEVSKPEGYEFFSQPPALLRSPDPKTEGQYIWLPNQEAENISHLPGGHTYYTRMLGGKDLQWISVFVEGQYGTTQSGKPVYPEYVDSVHCSKTPLEVMRGLPLLMGWDFGLNPSCVIAQVAPDGQIRVLAEATSEDMGVQRFVRQVVRPLLSTRFQGLPIIGVGDPAGSQRTQTTEQTCYNILAEEGLVAQPASTNEFVARREAVSYFMTRGLALGKAMLVLDPSCDIVRRGFLKGYQYAKMKTVDRYAEVPLKNMFSHLHDALQYLCLYVKDFGSPTGGNTGLPGGSLLRARAVVPQNMAAWS